MRKKSVVIIFFFCLNNFICLGQNISVTEMKSLIGDMVTLQVKSYQFNTLNSGLNNIPNDYVYKKVDFDIIKHKLSIEIPSTDVLEYKEFKNLSSKFIIFRVPYIFFNTWYIIAFGYDGSYYLLRNFDFNHFNNLIHQKIGRPKTINEYLDIGKLYINTVQFSDYGFRKVISTSEYHKLKKIHDSIAPPKLYNYKGDTILEFYSLQSSTNKVKHHKLIFNDGLIGNVEETPDDG